MIFDTHAHYEDSAFDADRDELISGLADAGICKVMDVASTLESIDQVLAVAHRYPGFYAALGIHPQECAPMTMQHLEEIRGKLRDPKVLAVGEIGLDYHWDTPGRDLQKLWFRRQAILAMEENKPIIVHSRDAAQDTYEILSRMHAEQTGGVIHCFSYSVEMAEKFLDLGFFIGIGGVVTFKNARKCREVVEAIPLTSIVLETDCPYMAPVPHRGERNCSLYLPLVAEAIAELKHVTPEEVCEQTRENAERLYRIS